MGRTTLQSLLLSTTLLASIGCADELRGLGPEIELSALQAETEALCEQIHCAPGFACELAQNSETGSHLVPTCIEQEGPKCQDISCGPAAECQMLEDDEGLVIPQCVPLACSNTPPEDEACPATCGTGYLMSGEGVTCSCCAPADEHEPALCSSNSDCGFGEVCDAINFCETLCQPGKPCSTDCFGRCTAADLVANPNRWQD